VFSQCTVTGVAHKVIGCAEVQFELNHDVGWSQVSQKAMYGSYVRASATALWKGSNATERAVLGEAVMHRVACFSNQAQKMAWRTSEVTGLSQDEIAINRDIAAFTTTQSAGARFLTGRGTVRILLTGFESGTHMGAWGQVDAHACVVVALRAAGRRRFVVYDPAPYTCTKGTGAHLISQPIRNVLRLAGASTTNTFIVRQAQQPPIAKVQKQCRTRCVQWLRRQRWETIWTRLDNADGESSAEGI
jgi:hypothetical protein